MCYFLILEFTKGTELIENPHKNTNAPHTAYQTSMQAVFQVVQHDCLMTETPRISQLLSPRGQLFLKFQPGAEALEDSRRELLVSSLWWNSEAVGFHVNYNKIDKLASKSEGQPEQQQQKMKAVSFLLILLNELKLECEIRFCQGLPVKYNLVTKILMGVPSSSCFR